MNQSETGMFIARKRKEKNFTQAQLAGRLGVSNKTISKWETGKCMPDYGIIQELCKELEITVAELMDGEEAEPYSIRGYDEEQVLSLVGRIQKLENQKLSMYGMILTAVGIALFAAHFSVGGSAARDFFSGMLMGGSVGIMLTGVFITACGLYKQN